MRTTTIPLLTDKPLPVIGTGAMPLSNARADGELMPRDEAIAVLHHAFDAGLRLVDTADIYAPSASEVGHNESIVGEAVRTWAGGRDLIVVITKIGITRTPGPPESEWGRDGSRDYLLRAAEASVTALGFEPDAILNHRVNREQQPYADTVRGMLAVREAGFAPAIGIGNINLDEARIAWEVSEGTIAAVENERSPRYRGDTDVFEWAIANDVAYFPWSPFGGGDDARNLPLAYPEFAAVAAELHGVHRRRGDRARGGARLARLAGPHGRADPGLLPLPHGRLRRARGVPRPQRRPEGPPRRHRGQQRVRLPRLTPAQPPPLTPGASGWGGSVSAGLGLPT